MFLLMPRPATHRNEMVKTIPGCSATPALAWPAREGVGVTQSQAPSVEEAFTVLTSPPFHYPSTNSRRK